MISEINLKESTEHLIKILCVQKVEVGMISFNNSDEINKVPQEFQKIGNFELDIIAINRDNYKLVLLDHDQSDHIMGIIANNLKSFLQALGLIENLFNRIDEDDQLFDDEIEIKKITARSAMIAGNIEFQSFYDMIFGV